MLLSKHVFRRLLPTRLRSTRVQKPSKPNVNGGSVRTYPASRAAITSHGIVTPVPDVLPPKSSSDEDATPRPHVQPAYVSPFQLITGYATFAKRASRPFPPPFISTPSTSFSDPLTTHSAIRDRRPAIDGEFILGATNGDDAVFVTQHYLVVNDGVGAWAAKPRGHAALWSRLVGHFWVMEVERWMIGGVKATTPEEGSNASTKKADDTGEATTEEEKRSVDESASSSTDTGAEEKESTQNSSKDTLHSKAESEDLTTQSGADHSDTEPDPVAFLQAAFERTLSATKQANDILGTTTFVSALLHYRTPPDQQQPPSQNTSKATFEPLLYVTNLGDSTVLVVRPKGQEVIYRSKEQWHWFDCPRQLGTNSPDTPNSNAVVDKVEVQEGDLVVAVSDGVVDNLWEHEVCEVICDSLRNWTLYQEDKKNKGSTTSTAKPQSSPRARGKNEGGTEEPRQFPDHPVVELEGDDEEGMVFVARELVRCARVIAEDSFAESPFMERAVEEGLPFEGGKMDDITVAIGCVAKRKDEG